MGRPNGTANSMSLLFLVLLFQFPCKDCQRQLLDIGITVAQKLPDPPLDLPGSDEPVGPDPFQPYSGCDPTRVLQQEPLKPRLALRSGEEPSEVVYPGQIPFVPEDVVQ